MALMGADPPLPLPIGATPPGAPPMGVQATFWAVTVSGDTADAAFAMQNGRMCMPARGARRPPPPAPPSPPQRTTACTTNRPDHTAGAFSLTTDCRTTSDGSVVSTSHMATTGTPSDYRVRREAHFAARDGHPERTLRMDMHYVYLGDCPANVKPGETLLADGKIIDAAKVAAARRAARAKADEGKP